MLGVSTQTLKMSRSSLCCASSLYVFISTSLSLTLYLLWRTVPLIARGELLSSKLGSTIAAQVKQCYVHPIQPAYLLAN